MKELLLLLLIGLSSTFEEPRPSPVAIVNAELNQLLGEWYIGVVYQWGYDNQKPCVYECAFFNISFDGRTVNTLETWTNFNSTNNNTYTFEYGNQVGTMWKSSTFDWFILGIDPISQSWLVLGGNNQTAYILERTANSLNNTTLNAIFYLLRGERYYVNNTNYFTVTNDCYDGWVMDS